MPAAGMTCFLMAITKPQLSRTCHSYVGPCEGLESMGGGLKKTAFEAIDPMLPHNQPQG